MRTLLKSFAYLLISLSTMPVSVLAQTAGDPTTAPAAPAVDQHGPTIKDTFKGHFLIGTAADVPGNFSAEELNIIKENYNILTPENCFKPASVHPEENTWNFVATDAMVKWCEQNNIAIHGHTLSWHAQTNPWFFAGGDRATIIKRLQDHIATLVGRYKGKIYSWDVVNEAINDHANSQTENLRPSQWAQTVGPQYLNIAFEAAHAADPDAKLYYNDYNIENGPKHASSMLLLRRLINEHAPIYGVGIQGHWSTTNLPYQALDKAVSDYASLGFKVSISELDITVAGTSGGQLNPTSQPGAGNRFRRNRGPSLLSAPALAAQAVAYARVFTILEKHRDVMDRVTFWGLNDRRSWRRGENPLIFDINNLRKPAYLAIVDSLTKPSEMP